MDGPMMQEVRKVVAKGHSLYVLMSPSWLNIGLEYILNLTDAEKQRINFTRENIETSFPDPNERDEIGLTSLKLNELFPREYRTTDDLMNQYYFDTHGVDPTKLPALQSGGKKYKSKKSKKYRKKSRKSKKSRKYKKSRRKKR
jgi:hypothetical protein